MSPELILASLIGAIGFSGMAALGVAIWNAPGYIIPQSLPPLKIAEPLPVPKWTREDAAKSAEMYRKVPSAFWLAPEYTRFDGPAEPPWGVPVYASVAEPRSPIFRSLVGGYWRGHKVIAVHRDIMRDGYRLRLEGDESVFLTARDMQDTMMHYGY